MVDNVGVNDHKISFGPEDNQETFSTNTQGPIERPTGSVPTEIQDAYTAIKEYEGKDYETLPEADKKRLTDSVLLVRNYMSTKAEYNAIYADNPFTSAQDVAFVLGFTKEFNAKALATLLFGRPVLPSPPTDAVGNRTSLPPDIAGNEWFSGNALAILRIATMEIEKVNRYAALKLGMTSAELTSFTTAIAKSIAHFTKKIYEANAREAMFEIVGAAAGIAANLASLTTIGIGGYAGFRGAKGAPPKGGGMTAEVEPPATGAGKTSATGAADADAKPTPTRWEGAAKGAYEAQVTFGQTIGGIGGNLDKLITSIGKMEGETDKGFYERTKIQLEQAQKLFEQVMKTIQEQRTADLQDNDGWRKGLDEKNQQASQLFNWQLH